MKQTLSMIAAMVPCAAWLPCARADIGVAIADPTTVGVSWFTHAGHSVVYLSDVCADGPLRARLCRADEPGSVVTMYPNFYERQPYAWNIVPLHLYLEGLETPGSRLLYASANTKAALELHARIGYLSPVCGSHACAQREHAYWRDLVGSTMDRDLFVYAVHTSRRQDEAIVHWLNDSANRNRYNSFTYNCSNFTAALVNNIFPHSVHRNLLNDLGMMSPKGAARSFTRWAAHRPELGLYALHFAQQPGSLPRAGLARSGTEDGFHMKKYMIPAALIGDHEVFGSFLVAYYFTGQFGLYKEYVRYAAPAPADATGGAEEPSGLPALGADAQPESDLARPAALVRVSAAAGAAGDNPGIKGGVTVVGSAAEWAGYRAAFAVLLQQQGMTPRASGPAVAFPSAFAQGRVWTDREGRPFMTMGSGGESLTVGLSSDGLLDPQSDPLLAFQLMLARVAYALDAKNHYRESMPLFRDDWALLQATRARLDAGQQSGAPLTDVAARR